MAKRLTIGHAPVGKIEKLGPGVRGYTEGLRVIAAAICTSGHSHAALCGCHAQEGPGTNHGWKPMGGWKFGNTIDGTQADYVLVPDAMVNLAPVPDSLTDEQVLMCPDINRRRAPHGAATIIGVESVPARMEMARRIGADHVIDFTKADPVAEIMRLTDGRAGSTSLSRHLGGRETFEAALRVLRPGGTLSPLGSIQAT